MVFATYTTHFNVYKISGLYLRVNTRFPYQMTLVYFNSNTTGPASGAMAAYPSKPLNPLVGTVRNGFRDARHVSIYPLFSFSHCTIGLWLLITILVYYLFLQIYYHLASPKCAFVKKRRFSYIYQMHWASIDPSLRCLYKFIYSFVTATTGY